MTQHTHSQHSTQHTSAYNASATSHRHAHTASGASAHRGSHTHSSHAPQRDEAAAYSRYVAADSRYKPEKQAKKKKSAKGKIIAAVVIVALLGVGGFVFYDQFIRHFNVEVNGETIRVEQGNTIATLLDEDYVHPTAGNLLAIDGSILKLYEGERCSATINGEKATVDSELVRDAVIEIGDGGDLTEEATVTEEVIPAGRSSDSYEFGAYWSGPIHLLSDGRDGKQRTTTGTVSGMTQVEVISPAIDSGYKILSVEPSEKVIALTFDDGPWPETTDAILDILEENNAKATFFTIGEQISEYSDAVKRAHNMGCQICTHTWDHASGSGQGVDLTLMSSSEQIDEVQRGFAAIKDCIGEEPSKIMRAPGGNFHGQIIDNLWSYVDAEIGWSIDTRDWAQPGADSIASSILSAESGDVILMHDGGGDRWQTVEGLRQALPTLVADGYKFVTIDELLTYL